MLTCSVYGNDLLHRQGWWAWGLSALGYPTAKGDHSPKLQEGLPSGFTAADMQELRTALSLDSFDSQHGTDAKESARKLETAADVQVSCQSWTCRLGFQQPLCRLQTNAVRSREPCTRLVHTTSCLTGQCHS